MSFKIDPKSMATLLLTEVFEERGRVFVTASGCDPTDPMQYWVECGKHGERIQIDYHPVTSRQGVMSWRVVDEAFKKCTGCIALEQRKEARKTKAEYDKSSWPEGAEL